MEKLTDWRGTPVDVGDIVVYASRQSSSIWMNEGEVVSIDWVETNWGRKEWKVGVKGTRESRRSWSNVKSREKTGKTVYPSTDRLTVIEKGDKNAETN